MIDLQQMDYLIGLR